MLLVWFPSNSLNIKKLLFSDNSTVQMNYDREVTHYAQNFQPKMSSPMLVTCWSHHFSFLTRAWNLPSFFVYCNVPPFQCEISNRKGKQKNSTIPCNLLRIGERTWKCEPLLHQAPQQRWLESDSLVPVLQCTSSCHLQQRVPHDIQLQQPQPVGASSGWTVLKLPYPFPLKTEHDRINFQTLSLRKLVKVRNKMQQHFQISFIFILFYFICHTIITKNMGKEEKRSGEET